ncbi:Uncharacterised protein [Proteus mirabilis]|uniref:Uncharacterized protein n=1 Tax=Proteus mirabilis TaxID=584 RepID=A0A2X2BUX2_PROMI|nr:Uncharacterised protein [Proteus mirabilis]
MLYMKDGCPPILPLNSLKNALLSSENECHVFAPSFQGILANKKDSIMRFLSCFQP